MTRRRLVPLLALAFVAGCGGEAADPPAPRTAAPDAPPAELAANDGRVGPATVADGRRARTLERRVRRIDPSAARRARERMGVGAGAACQDGDLLPSAETLPAVEVATLCLVNGERADAGLPALTPDPALTRAALGHSRAMVDGQFFSHTGAGGESAVDRIRTAGYIPNDVAWIVGENLAWGTGNLGTPRSIVAAWMASPGHRENILRSRFTQVGQGIVLGNPRSRDGAGATYTMTFGNLTGAATAPVAAKEPAPSGAGRAADKRRGERKRRASRSARRAKARRLAARRARARQAARRAKTGRAIARRALAPTARGQ